MQEVYYRGQEIIHLLLADFCYFRHLHFMPFGFFSHITITHIIFIACIITQVFLAKFFLLRSHMRNYNFLDTVGINHGAYNLYGPGRIVKDFFKVSSKRFRLRSYIRHQEKTHFKMSLNSTRALMKFARLLLISSTASI